MKELEKDMAMLRNGMKEVGREVEFYRTQPPVNGDRYVTFNLPPIQKMSMSAREMVKKSFFFFKGEIP